LHHLQRPHRPASHSKTHHRPQDRLRRLATTVSADCLSALTAMDHLRRDLLCPRRLLLVLRRLWLHLVLAPLRVLVTVSTNPALILMEQSVGVSLQLLRNPLLCLMH
jgi:hypothetical protein